MLRQHARTISVDSALMHSRSDCQLWSPRGDHVQSRIHLYFHVEWLDVVLLHAFAAALVPFLYVETHGSLARAHLILCTPSCAARLDAAQLQPVSVRG